jgi:adenylate kinase
VYAEKTQPVVSYYLRTGQLRTVRAEGSLEEITERLLAALAEAVAPVPSATAAPKKPRKKAPAKKAAARKRAARRAKPKAKVRARRIVRKSAAKRAAPKRKVAKRVRVVRKKTRPAVRRSRARRGK